jgi:hypothetical protein
MKVTHLKRQANIVFIFLIIINTRVYFAYFILFVSCMYFFAIIFFVSLICDSSLRIKNHYNKLDKQLTTFASQIT